MRARQIAARRSDFLIILKRLHLGLAALLTVACLSPDGGEPVEYGIQASHAGYVPAASAILPCQLWPQAAGFADLPLTSAKPDEIAELCTAFDQFVMEGFSGQPYMRGYARGVEKASAAAGRANHIKDLTKHWQHLDSDCSQCTSAPTFYVRSISTRPDWLQWLTDLSNAAYNVDAVLLPMIVYAQERRYEDRGLFVVDRGAAAMMLLIDTATGRLIWSNAREALVSEKRLNRAPLPPSSTSTEGGAPSGPLAPPPWSELASRLFTEDLWHEYPGRQIN